MPALAFALFGVINAGKSSLINALTRSDQRATSPVGGTTRAVEALRWRTFEAGPGETLDVDLIDTPGIEEIGDTALADAAIAAARAADLVLFVIAEDLTDSALSALQKLRAFGKPMVVALNKVDLLDELEVENILESVRQRLAGIVPPADVIPISAAPVVRERLRDADGSTRTIVRRDEPRIANLEARLVAAILESSQDLRALNAASLEAEQLIAARVTLKRERRQIAERVADETSIALAFAMAVNPIPLIDFLTGPGGVAILVLRVANAYGESPSREAARSLATQLVKGGRTVFWGSVAGVFVGGAMKLLPGLGHLAGALTQAASAGYVAHILGRALVDYHENDHDWGEGGLIAQLERIAAATDRKEITQGLVDRIKARLQGRES